MLVFSLLDLLMYVQDQVADLKELCHALKNDKAEVERKLSHIRGVGPPMPFTSTQAIKDFQINWSIKTLSCTVCHVFVHCPGGSQR